MNKAKVLTIISIILLCYCLTVKVVDVYGLHPVAGAIYELTALIVLAAAFVIPVVSIVFLIKSKSAYKKEFLIPLIISVATILVVFFFPFMYVVAPKP